MSNAILIITELSDKQKEYQKVFKAMLAKFGVDSPADLSDEEKKKFFNAVDAAFNSDDEAGKDGPTEGYSDRRKKMMENRKLRNSIIRRYWPSLLEVEGPSDEGDSKGAAGAAPDEELENALSELVIEFPDQLRIEFKCNVTEVETIKTRAQELHDEGLEAKEVADKIVEEFPECTFEVQDPKGKNAEVDDDEEGEEQVKKEHLSFADFLKQGPDALEEIYRSKKQDQGVREEIEAVLYQVSSLVQEATDTIGKASPKARAGLVQMIAENLMAQGELITEKTEELTAAGDPKEKVAVGYHKRGRNQFKGSGGSYNR